LAPVCAGAATKDTHALPPRRTSGVAHIVVVMVENRSFDDLLGGRALLPRRGDLDVSHGLIAHR